MLKQLIELILNQGISFSHEFKSNSRRYTDSKDYIWGKRKMSTSLDWDTILKNKRYWEAVVWHHSASKDSAVRDWDSIKRYHMSYRIDGNSVTKDEFTHKLEKKDGKNFEWPWKDIGYHFGIEKVLDQYKVFIGRPLSEIGAHCSQNEMNKKAIGVCLIGSFDLQPPCKEQLNLAVQLAKEINQHFNLKPENHFFHRDFCKYKSCPGTRFVDIESFRKMML